MKHITFLSLVILFVLGCQKQSPPSGQAENSLTEDRSSRPNGSTLMQIQKRGHLVCGVTQGTPGFSSPNSEGKWEGFDVDICRAVSAAIFGDADKVKYVPLSAQTRFTALQSGEIDILSRITTWTLGRDTAQGLNFAPTTFYDGQGFMVNKKSGIKKSLELKGASICTQQGTTTELNMADYFRKNRIKFKAVVFENDEEMVNAFVSGRCDAITSDSSSLVSYRSKFKNPQDYIILPEIISKEPLGPSVRHGDDQWFDVVKWSVYATFQGEEFGITSGNIDQNMNSQNPEIKRFLGIIPGMGKNLSLDKKWAYNIIKMVGNYGEIFERNVGKDSPLNLERGNNDLWTRGGLIYAPPIR